MPNPIQRYLVFTLLVCLLLLGKPPLDCQAGDPTPPGPIIAAVAAGAAQTNGLASVRTAAAIPLEELDCIRGKGPGGGAVEGGAAPQIGRIILWDENQLTGAGSAQFVNSQSGIGSKQVNWTLFGNH